MLPWIHIAVTVQSRNLSGVAEPGYGRQDHRDEEGLANGNAPKR